MKALPILMHGRSVRNLLVGRKTHTRRIAKLNAAGRVEGGGRQWHIDDPDAIKASPKGLPGDLLYVRENLGVVGEGIEYQADSALAVDLSAPPDDRGVDLWNRYAHEDGPDIHPTTIPSIHMPRWASRLTLHLTDVRLERVQEISEPDAFAEGAPMAHYGEAFDIPARFMDRGSFPTHASVYGFQQLWDDTNGAGAWDRNDWVWVYAFDVIHANVDDVLADPARYGIPEAA